MLVVAAVIARRAPSPEIRTRDTLNGGAANGSPGVNSAPDGKGQEDQGDDRIASPHFPSQGPWGQ
jgi:hypothetical protein